VDMEVTVPEEAEEVEVGEDTEEKQQVPRGDLQPTMEELQARVKQEDEAQVGGNEPPGASGVMVTPKKKVDNDN